jgi:hypothetical protein
MGDRRRVRGAGALLTAVALVGGCGGAAVSEVIEGSYESLVPSAEQIAVDVEGALPGGVVRLRDDGFERVDVEIGADQVTFVLDGTEVATHRIGERVAVTDDEGSGPFKAKRQVLVLSDGPLVLGGLRIDDPVIWPGSFEGSPVITITSRDLGERGPTMSCRADAACLLLSSGVDPTGSYADANDPELGENPIDTIDIDDSSVVLTLDDGDRVGLDIGAGTTSNACGLSETSLWDVPSELGLGLDDPVLVHTLCPSTPGAAVQLVIMDRSAIPVLAPLTEETEGEWCRAGGDCLLFVPTS